jgi:hypothetical protein
MMILYKIYDFVKDELKANNPTIFDITKERLIRAGNKIQADKVALRHRQLCLSLRKNQE